MCGVWWVSVEQVFELLPYVCWLVGTAGYAGGGWFRLLKHMFYLPTGVDAPSPV
jgi:hypothetical protein